MVAILQGQRDRYKERMTKAESAMYPLQQQLEAASAAKAQLEGDNLALYGKIRYLKSLNDKSSGMGYGAFSPVPGMRINSRGSHNHYDEERGDDKEREARYSKLYESKMSPFEQFNKIEKNRKLGELSVADRIVLNTSVALVSNATGRKFLMGYVIGMHILVFFAMYFTAHRVHCDPTFESGSSFDHHAAEAAEHGVTVHQRW